MCTRVGHLVLHEGLHGLYEYLCDMVHLGLGEPVCWWHVLVDFILSRGGITAYFTFGRTGGFLC